MKGTEVRREHLMEGKYFHCKCTRCLDPTELETNLSSLFCKYCEKGLVIYRESLAVWRCDLCNKEQSSQEINGILIAAKTEILQVTSIQRLEQLIVTYSMLLNPNHYLVVDMKQKLAAILRNICDQERMPQPKILRRKMELCEEILPIIRVLQPGISRLKAIALFEYFNSMAELTIHELNGKTIAIVDGTVIFDFSCLHEYSVTVN